MSLCQGCGASYDDNYKFCPHCGRAKPEPEAINFNVQNGRTTLAFRQFNAGTAATCAR